LGGHATQDGHWFHRYAAIPTGGAGIPSWHGVASGVIRADGCGAHIIDLSLFFSPTNRPESAPATRQQHRVRSLDARPPRAPSARAPDAPASVLVLRGGCQVGCHVWHGAEVRWGGWRAPASAISVLAKPQTYLSHQSFRAIAEKPSYSPENVVISERFDSDALLDARRHDAPRCARVRSVEAVEASFRDVDGGLPRAALRINGLSNSPHSE